MRSRYGALLGSPSKKVRETEKAYPSAVGMPFVICGYIRKICGYFLAGTPNSTPFFRSAAHVQPLPAPCLYPVSHKFIKLFQICGAE